MAGEKQKSSEEGRGGGAIPRDRWLQLDGLGVAPPTVTQVEADPGDGGPARRHDHAAAPPLQGWRLEDAGHPVPSRSVRVPPSELTGVQSRDLEFAEVAWGLFAAQ